MIPPKLFISYSWSNPDHEQWVINLATNLRESGVDVIFDKWDLKEGHDAIAFMEQMVNDPEIKKVVMVCDEKYASKANSRAGGVGTETQIISRDVYEKQDQEKFVALVCEKDKEGKPYLPTYYRSRIYIDLSELDNYAENFERLLRWIFDKPLYEKPEIGNPPSFLSDDHTSLGTTSYFRRSIDAIKNNKSYATGAFDEYCQIFTANLERFRIRKFEGEFDDAVIKNLEDFLPYQNEILQLLIAIAQYSPVEEFIHHIHTLLENLLPYLIPPTNFPYKDWDFDNFRFIIHELFLYSIATLLKYERFEQVNYLLEQHYYVPGNLAYGKEVMEGFDIFDYEIKSLSYRNQRLKLNRLSLRADILKQRCSVIGLEFRYLMQADFVGFMRAEIESSNDYRLRWMPETLIFVVHSNYPFEIFARSVSKAYFDKVKVILRIQSPKDIEPLLQSYHDNRNGLPNWEYRRINPAALLGYDRLATRP